MIHLYLSARALNAARLIDPTVSAAAVHAAVEIAAGEELLRAAGQSPAQIKARADALLGGPEVDDARAA